MNAKVFHPIPHDLKEGCLAMDGRRNGLHIPKRRKVWHSVIQAQGNWRNSQGHAIINRILREQRRFMII